MAPEPVEEPASRDAQYCIGGYFDELGERFADGFDPAISISADVVELTELEDHARDRGVDVVRLETNDSLSEAIGLYRSAGYEEVDPFNDEPFAHRWFEKRLKPVG